MSKYTNDLALIVLTPCNIRENLTDRYRSRTIRSIELRFQCPGGHSAILNCRTDDISVYFVCRSCTLNTGAAHRHAAAKCAVNKLPVKAAIIGRQNIPLDIAIF